MPYVSPFLGSMAHQHLFRAVLADWFAGTEAPPPSEVLKACLVSVCAEIAVRKAQFKELQPIPFSSRPLSLSLADKSIRAQAQHVLQVLVPARRFLLQCQSASSCSAGWRKLRAHLFSFACDVSPQRFYSVAFPGHVSDPVRRIGLCPTHQRIARELFQALGLSTPAAFGSNGTALSWFEALDSAERKQANDDKKTLYRKLQALLREHPVLSEAELDLLRISLGQR